MNFKYFLLSLLLSIMIPISTHSQDYLLLDLNQNSKIDPDEYKLLTQIFLSGGYTLPENSPPTPITKPFIEEISIITLPGDIPLEMIRIPSGWFMMGGSTEDNWNNRVEIEQQLVFISNDFYIGKYEVTQQQYEAVMGENPSIFKNSKNPIENASWLEFREFINKLNDIIPSAGFRFPTSAEWEYACRAKTDTTYYWSDDEGLVEEYEWSAADGNYKSQRVGMKEPNPWGLYDMQGNVSEFVMDGMLLNNSIFEMKNNIKLVSGAFLIDPVGIPSGDSAFIRGGNYMAPSSYYNAYYESGFLYHSRWDKESIIGMRLVRETADFGGETRVKDWMVW